MNIKKIYPEPKQIDVKLTKRIKDLMKKGENIIDIIMDIVRFENMDVYDVLDKIPDHMIEKIKKAFAERNHIAVDEFPEILNAKLDDDVF